MKCSMLVTEAGNELGLAGYDPGPTRPYAVDGPYSLATLQLRLEIMLRYVVSGCDTDSRSADGTPHGQNSQFTLVQTNPDKLVRRNILPHIVQPCQTNSDSQGTLPFGRQNRGTPAPRIGPALRELTVRPLRV